MAASPAECSPTKKAKLLENPEKCNGVHESLADLSTFQLEKILHNNTNRKTVCLRGKFASKHGEALVLLEKTAFAEENFKENSDYFTEKSSLEKVFHNDIYGNYNYFPQIKLNSIKATIIHPATELHFEKYSAQNCRIIDETPDIYEKVTLPHITQEQFNLTWVYNILEHKSESERIVFEDPDPETGFVLLPDLKWNGEIETLYLLAIVHKKDLKSLRDLTGDHLALLRNIQKKGIESIKSKYGLDGNQLRIYLHYQPSFYHLHVHFTYIKHEAPGILAERAHLLSNVIKKLTHCSKKFKMATSNFNVILEIRPRLQSVNVLVNLVEKLEIIDVVLKETSFKIVSGEATHDISCHNVKIVKNSLSSLVITDTYISFRFSTDNRLDDWGSFKAELLQTARTNTKTMPDVTFLNKSETYTIQCRNCQQLLSEPIEFSRVLPLPSENAEPDEWFCCGQANFVLEPKDTDVFYTFCYCHLRKKLICNVLQNKVLVCKRCLSWLGQAKSLTVVKLWFHTVLFKTDVQAYSTSVLQDVFKTLEDVLNGILFATAKLVLVCQSSNTQTDYLRLWILEKQLRLQICEEECKVAKVLFKCENVNEEVGKWLDDSSVATVEISKPMFVELMKELYKYNKMFPRAFSESNNFYISYLKMYDK